MYFCIYRYSAHLVPERVHKIRFSGTRNLPKNGFKTSWTRLFFIFAKFLAYLMIFQSFVVPFPSRCTLKNHQICRQKMKKSLVQLALNLFIHSNSKTRNPIFGSPIRHYHWLFITTLIDFSFLIQYYSFMKSVSQMQYQK